MSFAQGLLAGTQAARNALDAYKDSRQQRIEREFAQGLAAIDEQQKQGRAGLQDYYSGANTERFAEVPTQAPTQFSQGLMPEAVPQAPMTPEQVVQQQLALANRLGLRQEAGNYTNQLNALRQQQMEQARYDQQGLFNEQKFEADQAFRQDQLKLQKEQVDAQVAASNAQIKNLENSAKLARDEFENRVGQQESAAFLTRLPALASGRINQSFATGGSFVDVMNDVPEELKDNPALWHDAVYKQWEQISGMKVKDAISVAKEATKNLAAFTATPFVSPEAELSEFRRILTDIDPDLTDNITPVVERMEDGSYQVFYDNRPMLDIPTGNLKDIASKIVANTSGNMFGAIDLYERKKQGVIAAVKRAETVEAKRKVLLDLFKSNEMLVRDPALAEGLLPLFGFETGKSTAGTRFNVGATGTAAVQELSKIISGVETGGGTETPSPTSIKERLDVVTKPQRDKEQAAAKTKKEFDRKVLDVIMEFERGLSTPAEARELARSGGGGIDPDVLDRAIRAYTRRPLQDTRYFLDEERSKILGAE